MYTIMLFKFIILSFIFSISLSPRAEFVPTEQSPQNTHHVFVQSHNTISSSNQYTYVTKIYKDNSFKYVTYGVIFSGIIYLFYKIWKAHHD